MAVHSAEDKYLEAQGVVPGAVQYPESQHTPATYGQAPNPYVEPPAYTQAPQPTCSAAVVQHHKGIVDTYILAIGLGFFGAHHFYLRRYGFGLLYLFTFGLFGVGYVVDWFRVPCLVKEANKRIENPQQITTKSLCDAYLLWFPGGLFGFHHFYLERYVWGFFYLFTLGFFGIGWIIDGVRMKWLVQDVNKTLKNAPLESRYKGLGSAYAFTLFPITGLLGFQHYYLGRIIPGMFYTFTLGGLGCSWIMDWFRMPFVVKRENKKLTQPEIVGMAYHDDAWMYLFPLGFLGLHHFYLSRHGWGVLYLFTCGMFGVGWLVDLVRLPCLVNDYNKKLLSNHRNTLQTVAGQVPVEPGPGVTLIGENPNMPPSYGHQNQGYPGYQTFPPGPYPQPAPGIYPSAGQDSWSTVTSSNVSVQPPSYTDTVSADVETTQNSLNESAASAPPLFEKV